MKAVVQTYSTGQVRVVDVPAPRCPSNGILVRTTTSLVSIGTERSIIELGRKSLLGKARARPDLVKRALDKAKREGFWKTFQESLARLDSAIPLGYSSCGVVVEVGAAAHGFSPGDRVACVGQTFASHAEFAAVPANLACQVPASVTDDEAAFCMLGAIAMHGVRLTQLGLGGTVTVIGLGLLGILSAQILRAYGCQVVGMDPDDSKVDLCRKLGFTDVVRDAGELQDLVMQRTGGVGCDAVVIAAATNSHEPVDTAVGLCRQGGRVVLVGVADIHPNRNEMWNKEVEVVVSKAGGLGALDPVYELDGIDLPINVARWTQGRNVEEFLRLVAEKKVIVGSLVTHRSPIDDAESLYGELIDGKLENVVGVVLDYSGTEAPVRTVTLQEPRARGTVGRPGIAVLGAGLYGKSVFLPALAKQAAIDLNVLATSSGVNAEHAARKFGFRECSTDAHQAMARSDVDTVVALLPHAQHAKIVLESIRTGKHLLVEKPLCVSPEELTEIETALAGCNNPPVIMVGHNRRYSPHTAKMRSWLERRTVPLVMIIRINAGFVPADHWVHRDSEGRSRIVGEGTHFIDLAMAIIGSEVISVDAVRVRGDDKTVVNNDNYCAQLGFADGSIASLVYTAQGPRTVSREVIEIFSEGTTISSTDFRTTDRFTASGRTRFSTRAQDYGYQDEISHFFSAVRGTKPIEPRFGEMIHSMRVAFAIERSLAEGRRVLIKAESA
jgi:predicted dehydrogenase/threonine dehydrogenase-like Zn-dependent dehydrogenase